MFIKYLFLGGALTLLEWLGFYALAYIFGVPYLISSIVMFVAISLLGVFAYRRFIFGDSHLNFGSELVGVYLINIIGVVFNTAILWVCVEWLEIEAMVGKIIASFIVAFYGFWARKNFIYKGKSNEQEN